MTSQRIGISIKRKYSSAEAQGDIEVTFKKARAKPEYAPDAPAVRRLVMYVVDGGADDLLSLGLYELIVYWSHGVSSWAARCVI